MFLTSVLSYSILRKLVSNISKGNLMHKTIAKVAIGIIISLGLTSPVFANCTTQYGGNTTCTQENYSLNKMVQDPITGVFVENITSARFTNGNTVVYRITVQTTTENHIDNVKVEDQLPDNIRYADSNPTGSVNDAKSVVIFNLGGMDGHTQQTMFIWAKVTSPFPAEDPFCRDNTAILTGDNQNTQRDTARVCITNKILGSSSLPTAGVNDLVVMIPFLAMAGSGIALMRKK